eukprot:TRINITY_DN4527_c0_g1_i2.p2 TRINITY_DN4527_c0_g1~~TRINITY_DN4527_c0_g1_i2.p2  ORF type:complete len:147 (+),score=11.87 TRINITY_DN4527_c0_g1_i2:247-687(+)
MDKSMHNCRCSWCLDPTTHMCTKDNSGKKKRSIYECGACHNRTLPCKKGCGAMTKGGFWDNDKCAKCSGDIKDWPTTAEQRTAMRYARYGYMSILRPFCPLISHSLAPSPVYAPATHSIPILFLVSLMHHPAILTIPRHLFTTVLP